MDVPLHDDLDGQVALVTGANRGLGARIAADLADLGAVVYAGVRDADYEAPGDQRVVELDVTDEESIRAAVSCIEVEADRLDVLVNNAGITDPSGNTLVDDSVDDVDAVLQTNLRGPMLLAKFALPLLLRRPGGRVVNLSSGMGALGEEMTGGAPAYRVSKTGLNGLTAYLHGEYRDDGLLANSVCPGWVRTDMGGESAPRSVAAGADTPVWLSRFAPDAPGGRFWRDREVVDW
ncbi:SDR family NAD(P)-dependent oxidoreductase [Haloarchaeobius amylolyticus]|uniref:SDR family NAD(P)-dependent oxidoreductase n=1 Tax=Haloarchaeobius amylolyticus TaxID=1198296 RepID=UPI00226D8C45|nr:SDR family NAD(P)-dependent oxidoreductase [Haloarchaeobius amylolyticus]